ncbi:MAG: hypothetical protein V7L27_01645 [Nostoc sp.]|uniref:hypothetical protein n=1 Tax=Nostoc sp. TaxID=1180 RepID=UPI002FF45A5F
MKIINLKDAINRRLYKRLIIVETAIHRVSCLNRTVLGQEGKSKKAKVKRKNAYFRHLRKRT